MSRHVSIETTNPAFCSIRKANVFRSCLAAIDNPAREDRFDVISWTPPCAARDVLFLPAAATDVREHTNMPIINEMSRPGDGLISAKTREMNVSPREYITVQSTVSAKSRPGGRSAQPALFGRRRITINIELSLEEALAMTAENHRSATLAELSRRVDRAIRDQHSSLTQSRRDLIVQDLFHKLQEATEIRRTTTVRHVAYNEPVDASD